jgi:integrase
LRETRANCVLGAAIWPQEKVGASAFDPGVEDRQAWNAGRKVGAKRALKPKQIWGIRSYLDHRRRLRDHALFDLAIDSKLRGCAVVRLKIGDVVSSGQVRTRTTVMQTKTGKPVQFELLSDARAGLLAWLQRWGGALSDYVFPSRIDMPIFSVPANMLGSSMNGHGNRFAAGGIWHTLVQANQGIARVQGDEQSKGSPDSARNGDILPTNILPKVG